MDEDGWFWLYRRCHHHHHRLAVLTLVMRDDGTLGLRFEGCVWRAWMAAFQNAL